MVFFDIVEKKSFWYSFFRKWLALIFSKAYYRRFHVLHKENLPPAGTPVLMVSNHQNGLIDALAILFALPLRYVAVFLARADIFKKKNTAKILNFCKVMPVYRQRDGRDNLGENAAIFNEAAKLIAMGYPVGMFPEGQHQEGHYLAPVKKGFARIAFEAAERNGFPENMLVMPVGNHYSDYFASRAKLCIRFGTPVKLSKYYDTYRDNPPKAMTLLAEEIQAAIRAQMLDIPTEHYATYDFLREAVRPSVCGKEGLRLRYFPHQLEADRRLMAHIVRTEPQRMEQVRAAADTYRAALEKHRLSVRDIDRPVSFCRILADLLLLAAGFPFAIYGICFTGLPVWFGRRKARQISLRIKNPMLRTSFDFVLTQLIMTGLFYIVYIVLYWIFIRSWIWFVPVLASWMLTRAFWQDYLHYARRAGYRLRAFCHHRVCKQLRVLGMELNDWAIEE